MKIFIRLSEFYHQLSFSQSKKGWAVGQPSWFVDSMFDIIWSQVSAGFARYSKMLFHHYANFELLIEKNPGYYINFA